MRAGSSLSSGLSPRLSDLRPSATSGAAAASEPARARSPVRRPAGPRYPQPDGLHIKLTSEAYLGSLRCPLGGMAILPGAAPRPRGRPPPAFLTRAGTGVKETASAGKIKQTAPA